MPQLEFCAVKFYPNRALQNFTMKILKFTLNSRRLRNFTRSIRRHNFYPVKFFITKSTAAKFYWVKFRSGIRHCKILYCKTRAQNSARLRLIRRKSAVYRKYRAADPFRLVRRQKHRRIADVLRATDFAERIDIFYHLFKRLAPLRAKRV